MKTQVLLSCLLLCSSLSLLGGFAIRHINNQSGGKITVSEKPFNNGQMFKFGIDAGDFGLPDYSYGSAHFLKIEIGAKKYNLVEAKGTIAEVFFPLTKNGLFNLILIVNNDNSFDFIQIP